MIDFANNLIVNFEKDSDRRISAICRYLTVLDFFIILLNVVHVFKISMALYPTLIVSGVILMVPTLFFDILKKRSKKKQIFCPDAACVDVWCYVFDFVVSCHYHVGFACGCFMSVL